MVIVLLMMLMAFIVGGCIATGALFYLEWKENYILTHKAGRTGV